MNIGIHHRETPLRITAADSTLSRQPSTVNPLLPGLPELKNTWLQIAPPSWGGPNPVTGQCGGLQGLFIWTQLGTTLETTPTSGLPVGLVRTYHWDLIAAGLVPLLSPSSFPSRLPVLLPRAPLITSCMLISNSVCFWRKPTCDRPPASKRLSRVRSPVKPKPLCPVLRSGPPEVRYSGWSFRHMSGYLLFLGRTAFKASDRGEINRGPNTHFKHCHSQIWLWQVWQGFLASSS